MAIQNIKTNGLSAEDTKPLRGKKKQYRLRIGKQIHIIFTRTNGSLTIFDADNQDSIYKY